MSRKSSSRGIASATALLSQALLIAILSASIQGAGELVANEYGEIDEVPAVTASVAEGGAAALPADSEASEVATNGLTEAEVASTFTEKAVTNGEVAAETNASETASSAEGVRNEEEVAEEEAEPVMAEAVVYVFNNDDDTLSISLFVDSELEGTEDVSKEKEKKFGNYELLAGSHNFKISWWDDDTKKTYQEEQVVEIEETTAVTLYTTQNKEPEEFEVSVMLRNDNTEDLEAYLYIDDEYEKQKTAKKESTTDFGKFDLEEGTHELAVRWQDPETNIDYEKRKTIRVDGTDVITFYAPKGMTFDIEEVAASKTTTSKTTTSSKTDTTSTKTTSTKTASTSTTTKDDDKVETSSKTAGSDTKQTSIDSSEAKASTDKSETSQEKTSSDDESAENEEGSGHDAMNLTLLLSTIGAILAIYFIFFRR